SLFFFFFFQAEDGIRDLIVTGVQTCTLPISTGALPFVLLPIIAIVRVPTPYPAAMVGIAVIASAILALVIRTPLAPRRAWNLARSEERRVGKEWRCAGWRDA